VGKFFRRSIGHWNLEPTDLFSRVRHRRADAANGKRRYFRGISEDETGMEKDMEKVFFNLKSTGG
jgi:hypothetical protein